MMKFIEVIFSISCLLALVKSMNDMGSLSFKCIFDPAKTITSIVPGLLVIQHAYEYDSSYGTNLQAVDCFINVARNSIINKQVEEITQEFETRDLRIAVEPLNGIVYNEYVEKPKAKGKDNAVEGQGLQKRKLKRVINTKDGAEVEIYYRSIAEDKQFKMQKFTKLTKIISSKKAPHIIVNSKKTHVNNTIKSVLSLRKRTAYQRSINEDKFFKIKNYTKITKRLKSKFIKEKIALAKKSTKKVEGVVKEIRKSKSVNCDSDKCYKKGFYSKSKPIENYCPKTSKAIATHTSIVPTEATYKIPRKETFEKHDASNKGISTIASIETDYKKPSKKAFEEHDPSDDAISTIAAIESDYKKQSVAPFGNNPYKIKGSIENNILDSEIPITANEILDEKPKHLLFVKINPDDLMENILFHPRVIYA